MAEIQEVRAFWRIVNKRITAIEEVKKENYNSNLTIKRSQRELRHKS